MIGWLVLFVVLSIALGALVLYQGRALSLMRAKRTEDVIATLRAQAAADGLSWADMNRAHAASEKRKRQASRRAGQT